MFCGSGGFLVPKAGSASKFSCQKEKGTPGEVWGSIFDGEEEEKDDEDEREEEEGPV